MEKKGNIRRTLWIFIAAYAIAFILFYIAYLIYDYRRESITALEYIRYFYLEIIKFSLPLLAGGVLLGVGTYMGTSYVMKRGWVLSISSVIFSIPYYYLYYFAMTIDTAEAILFGLINTVFDCAVFHLQAFLVYFLARWLIRIFAKKRKGDDITAEICEHSPLDISRPMTKAFILIVTFKFVISFIIETIRTVGYLNEYSGTYRVEEILYLVASYLFLVAELLITHFLALSLKNRIIKTKSKEA